MGQAVNGRLSMGLILEVSGSQSVVPGTVASASPGNLIKCSLGPHPGPSE